MTHCGSFQPYQFYNSMKCVSFIYNLKMLVSGHQERKISSLVDMRIDRMKCLLKTEEQKDWGAGLGNPILAEDPMPGSAASLSLASHSTMSPASREKVRTTVTRLFQQAVR